MAGSPGFSTSHVAPPRAGTPPTSTPTPGTGTEEDKASPCQSNCFAQCWLQLWTEPSVLEQEGTQGVVSLQFSAREGDGWRGPASVH